MALDSLHIRDPVLAQQWADKIERKNGQIHDNDQIRQELDKQHAPATIPSAPPATGPAIAP
jgi:hypothetical protein